MSLRLKTVIGVAFIEAVLLALLIYTVMSFMHDSAEEALLKRAYSTAALFSTTAKDPVLAYDLASLDAFSQELKKNPDIEYVRTRGTDGLLISSAGDPSIIDRAFNQDNSLDSVDDGIFDTFAVITESGIEYGRVEIGFNIDNIEAAIEDTRSLTTTIAIVEMILVAVFSLLLGNYLTKQLLVLQRAAKAISLGDYSQKLSINTKDEVAEVAVAFNRMTQALSESQASRDRYESALVELNKTLEHRVEKRTKKIKDQIEALKEADAKIAATQARLLQTEKLASIGQLSAGIAHEINNPIAFVNSNVISLSDYIELYQQLLSLYQTGKPEFTQANAELLAKIEQLETSEDIEFVNEDIVSLMSDTLDGISRVQEIVRGLKEFSHINENSKETCNIGECVESTLKIVKNELKNRVSIKLDLQEIPLVMANRGELNQVLMNLLINAGQAIDAEGEIMVSTSVEAGFVKISISDNGKGIAKEDLDKLFDPFFTTKPVGEGTGLGLSISYGIIENHGGSIQVDSEPNVGTSFHILLPVYNDKSLPVAA